MNSADDPLDPDNYACAFDMSPGWVNTTIISDSPEEARELGQEMLESFNPLELTVSKEELARNIARLALEAKKRRASYSAAYFADNGHHFALASIDVYGEDGVRVTPAEMQPELLKSPNGKVVGDPRVTYLDHALGPAVRVQAMFATKGILGLGRGLWESVRYAICPPDIDDVFVARVWWDTMAFSDQLTEMADELISTLHLIPLDADGNPIEGEKK